MPMHRNSYPGTQYPLLTLVPDSESALEPPTVPGYRVPGTNLVFKRPLTGVGSPGSQATLGSTRVPRNTSREQKTSFKHQFDPRGTASPNFGRSCTPGITSRPTSSPK
eukprot:3904451-Rhodomonas_salina.2